MSGGGHVDGDGDGDGASEGGISVGRGPRATVGSVQSLASLVGGDAISVHCLGSSVDGERLPLPVQIVPLRATNESDLGKPRALCSDGGCVYVGCTR